MNEIVVSLALNDDGRLVARTGEPVLGSQYDNRAAKLVFERPIDYAGDVLTLLFFDGRRQYEPVSIGNANEFEITNALTQTHHLEMQVAFLRNGEMLAHSNIITFALRPSLESGIEPVEEWPNQGLRLVSEAFTKATVAGRRLYFANLAGDIVDEVTLPSGGGGGSIEIGEVTAETLPAGSPATVELTDNDGVIDFAFGIPKGESIKGDDGYTPVKGVDYFDGENGDAATIAIGAVETGEPDTAASVVNTGSENAAVLHFVIPRGKDGKDGGDADLSAYATKTYVDEKISDVVPPELDLSNYATTVYVDEKIADVELTSGEDGADGKSAYQIAVEAGFSGSESEWLASLKGADGASIKGDDGEPAELRVDSGFIQWRVGDSGPWTNLVALATITGANGMPIELSASATHIRWRYMGEGTWRDLIPLSELKGAVGETGSTGSKGDDGFSPAVTPNAGNNATTYKLDITTETGSYTTPNLIGPQGPAGKDVDPATLSALQEDVATARQIADTAATTAATAGERAELGITNAAVAYQYAGAAFDAADAAQEAATTADSKAVAAQSTADSALNRADEAHDAVAEQNDRVMLLESLQLRYVTFTIPIAAWIASTDFVERPFQADISVLGITATGIAQAYFDAASMFAAIPHQIVTGKALADKIRLYSVTAPTVVLSGVVEVRRNAA